MRGALVGSGLALLGYGGWLLLSTQDVPQVRGVVVWAASAIVLHDLVLAPAALVLGWVASRSGGMGRVGGGPFGAAAAALLVVLGPAALVAIPVLGRFGADPDNPTLLARNYPAGLAAVAAVAIVCATFLALSGLISVKTAGRRSRGPGSRGR